MEYLDLIVKKPLFFGLWLIAVVTGTVFMPGNSWTRSAVVWTFGSLFVLVVYYLGCSDNRQSMVRLPWYKPWALLLLIVTLPWLAIWLGSLVRLIVSDPRKSVFKPRV